MEFFAQPQINPNATSETIVSNANVNCWYVYKTPAGVFDSRGEAMKANNCTADQLKSRCRRDSFPDWIRQIKPVFVDSREYHQQRTNNKNAAAATKKPVMTYYGPFPSVREAAEAAGVTTYTMARWIRKYPKHYYYIKGN